MNHSVVHSLGGHRRRKYSKRKLIRFHDRLVDDSKHVHEVQSQESHSSEVQNAKEDIKDTQQAVESSETVHNVNNFVKEEQTVEEQIKGVQNIIEQNFGARFFNALTREAEKFHASRIEAEHYHASHTEENNSHILHTEAEYSHASHTEADNSYASRAESEILSAYVMPPINAHVLPDRHEVPNERIILHNLPLKKRQRHSKKIVPFRIIQNDTKKPISVVHKNVNVIPRHAIGTARMAFPSKSKRKNSMKYKVIQGKYK